MIDGKWKYKDMKDKDILFEFKTEGNVIVGQLPAPGNRIITKTFNKSSTSNSTFDFSENEGRQLHQYKNKKVRWQTPTGTYLNLKRVDNTKLYALLILLVFFVFIVFFLIFLFS
jgi:hypothetical protein